MRFKLFTNSELTKLYCNQNNKTYNKIVKYRDFYLKDKILSNITHGRTVTKTKRFIAQCT